MDTSILSAALQVVVGGLLVFSTEVLIGSSWSGMHLGMRKHKAARMSQERQSSAGGALFGD
jgi:hypothetical protein